MKAVMISTNRFVELPQNGGRPRVWEGTTDSGIPFVAYVIAVHVGAGEKAAAFTRELKQSGPPSIAAENAIASGTAEVQSSPPWSLASANATAQVTEGAPVKGGDKDGGSPAQMKPRNGRVIRGQG